MKRIVVALYIVLLASCSSLQIANDLNKIGAPVEKAESTVSPAIEFTESDMTMEEALAYIESLGQEESAVEPLDTVVEEIVQPTEEDVADVVFEPLEELQEAIEVTVENEGNVHHIPSPSSDVHIGNSVLPMWFVYSVMVLCMACLFTICYISKQRKEYYWRRMRD